MGSRGRIGRPMVLAAGLIAACTAPARAHEDGVLAPHDLWAAWSFEPLVVLGLVLAAGLYVRGTASVWRRAGIGRGVRRRHAAAFAGGIGALVVALVSPLDALGGALFAAHMTQHEVLMLVAAPLLVLGNPLVAWLWALPIGWRRRLGRWSNVVPVRTLRRRLTRPVVAWLTYAVVFVVWHVPSLYEATLESDLVHSLQHASFLGAALLFWWVVVHPRGPRRIGYGVGLACIFTTFLYSGVVGALLTFSPRPWYPAYASRVEPWGMTPLEDQHLGGLIMWIPSGLVYVAAALVVLFAILRSTDRATERSPRGDGPGRPDRRRRRVEHPGRRPRRREESGRDGTGPSVPRGSGATVRILGASLLALAAAGCDGEVEQDVLDPVGRMAAEVEGLWWFFFGVAAFVCVAVTVLLLYGLLRARGVSPDRAEASERRRTRAVAGGGVATVVLLGAMFGASLVTGRSTLAPPGPAARTIEVIGYRFWWEVRYPVEDDTLVTANEVHLPAGVPVRFEVTTADVIHSFWIPNVHGKIDMIPGRVNSIRVRADEPGVYRGQCAEFCGMQHANMAFMVVVEPPDEFAAWLEAQREPASPPTEPRAVRGLRVFLDAGCAACHTIRGTPAAGRLGPDLTHLAGRLTLAAGTLPNTRGHLGGWIANPQRIKPGNNMPYVPLEPLELRALLHYLETLE